MKASISQPRAVGGQRRGRRDAFALIVTLLILSLLVVVAVSYLSSMVGERQTADAYSSKARAEQVAQAGVDSAMAILTESFRDFPDSATVWDTQQSQNTGNPYSTAIVNTPTNEGTSLYLRAVPTTATLPAVVPGGTATTATVADPRVSNTPTAANDSAGNNPNNPACKNFVLPLISGVPGGRARLVSEKLPPAADKAGMIPLMDLTKADPGLQNYTDLNVRRFAGDLQGVIGSPPDWVPTGGTPPVGPKPARALWVNLKDADGRTTGRYAFWMEDESFRANINYIGNAADTARARIDNAPDSATHKFPVDPTTKQPYILRAADGSLGNLLATTSTDGLIDAARVYDVRSLYPSNFFPEPLAFSHAFDADPKPSPSPSPDPTADFINASRYLTTTQSGTLNLSRHGTQRVNLNNTVVTADLNNDRSPYTKSQTAMQRQIDQIVGTIQFHLPNFGQRFYRTSTATDANTLNASQVVANIPNVGDPRKIYDYKVAANIRDYIDTDGQPTFVQSGGTVAPIGVPGAPGPVQPFGDDGQPNPMWAQGKEAAPCLQETAVRFRPKAPQSAAKGKGSYTLSVDYYLEFWNLSDHDIYAYPQADSTLAHLNGAQVRVSDQQTWVSYPSGSTPLTVSDPNKPPPRERTSDFTIDLLGGANNGVYLAGVLQDGSNGTSNGVVFRAGTATVITTDPDYQTYNFLTPIHSSTKYKSLTGVPNAKTTFYCPIVAPGTRTYAGTLNPDGGTSQYGLQPVFRDGTQDYGTEVTLFNRFGYIDCALFAIAEGGSPVFTTTDSATGDGDYCNYSYGGSLYGNSLASEAGDPRTNNEQMVFHRLNGAATGDVSRYYNGDHTLGYQNANYVQPLGGSGGLFGGSGASSSANFVAWPDYYTWPATNTPLIDLNAPVAPAVIADKPLASIGQLGDVYDPARVNASAIEAARGGGRTFKIGQRDDRVTYQVTGSPNASLDNVPASLGWAAWRLTDVFSAGPVDPANPTGPTQESVELPARININGVMRDKGAALRSALTGFAFQPATLDARTNPYTEHLFHTPTTLAGLPLLTQPSDSFGVTKIVTQIAARLTASPTAAATSNVPWGPFFERGEIGELETGGTAIFGKNAANSFVKTSTDLVNGVLDMNKTFDHGREEVFRRLADMVCTRGDTFTVYAVGQSLVQHDAASALKITATHRMRLTFRLVPKIKDPATGNYVPFHPAYATDASTGTVTGSVDFNPNSATELATRFSKPDLYDVQILETHTF